MATCPKCQLPNPEAVEACIWCGRHRFAAESPRAEEVVAAGSGDAEVAVVAPAVAGPSPTYLADSPPPVSPPDYKSLSSHLDLQFTARPDKPEASSHAGARTLASTPTARAAQLISTPPPGDSPTPQIRPKLVVLRGQKVNHEYPIYEGRNVIGRFADRPVDIDLVAQEAEGQIWSSRQHAAITFDRHLLMVEDLNSLNGTWVNGARLHAGQKRPLKPNDVIQIGTVQLKLVVS